MNTRDSVRPHSETMEKGDNFFRRTVNTHRKEGRSEVVTVNLSERKISFKDVSRVKTKKQGSLLSVRMNSILVKTPLVVLPASARGKGEVEPFPKQTLKRSTRRKGLSLYFSERTSSTCRGENQEF